MDDVSNRTSTVWTPAVGSATTTSYTSNNLNQYTVLGAASRSHDDNGNLTDDGTYDFSYDYQNNLVKVMDGATVVMEAEFDALGRRTKKTTDSGSTVVKYYYDDEHCVAEYDGSDSLLREFVYGQRLDEIRAMIAPDVLDVDDDSNTSEFTTYYFHHDRLGSVTHVTSVYEDLVEQYEYTPYGAPTLRDGSGSDLSGQSAIGNPYLFTGRRLDEETGLYHYRRRAYAPESGRFLQRDPLGYVDGPGLYTYAHSNPRRYTDPRGTTGVEDLDSAIQDLEQEYGEVDDLTPRSGPLGLVDFDALAKRVKKEVAATPAPIPVSGLGLPPVQSPAAVPLPAPNPNPPVPGPNIPLAPGGFGARGAGKPPQKRPGEAAYPEFEKRVNDAVSPLRVKHITEEDFPGFPPIGGGLEFPIGPGSRVWTGAGVRYGRLRDIPFHPYWWLFCGGFEVTFPGMNPFPWFFK